MLEVLLRFPAIGGIPQYQALSTGEKALYEQFILLLLEKENK